MRYPGFASSREIGAALGGLSPLVASALVIQGGGTGWPVAVRMLITAGISLVAFAFSRETKSLDITAPETVQR